MRCYVCSLPPALMHLRHSGIRFSSRTPTSLHYSKHGNYGSAQPTHIYPSYLGHAISSHPLPFQDQRSTETVAPMSSTSRRSSRSSSRKSLKLRSSTSTPPGENMKDSGIVNVQPEDGCKSLRVSSKVLCLFTDPNRD